MFLFIFTVSMLWAGQSLFYADIGKVGPDAAISMKQRVSESGKKNG